MQTATTPGVVIDLHEDDGNDDLLLATIQALLMLGNKPSSVGEILTVITEANLTQISGNQESIISNKLTTYIKKCTKSNRKAAIGKMAGPKSGIPRYHLKLPGIPILSLDDEPPCEDSQQGPSSVGVSGGEDKPQDAEPLGRKAPSQQRLAIESGSATVDAGLQVGGRGGGTGSKQSKSSPKKRPRTTDMNDEDLKLLEFADNDSDFDYGSKPSKKTKKKAKVDSSLMPGYNSNSSAKSLDDRRQTLLIESGKNGASISIEGTGEKKPRSKAPTLAHLRPTDHIPEELRPPPGIKVEPQRHACFTQLYKMFPRCKSCIARKAGFPCHYIGFRGFVEKPSGDTAIYFVPGGMYVNRKIGKRGPRNKKPMTRSIAENKRRTRNTVTNPKRVVDDEVESISSERDGASSVTADVETLPSTRPASEDGRASPDTSLEPIRLNESHKQGSTTKDYLQTRRRRKDQERTSLPSPESTPHEDSSHCGESHSDHLENTSLSTSSNNKSAFSRLNIASPEPEGHSKSSRPSGSQKQQYQHQLQDKRVHVSEASNLDNCTNDEEIVDEGYSALPISR
ncbi:hypothetical protein HDU76_001295 [Blyttiomyces sp. JEL0837]|nr:hypothetical protein HDU76_001295 [Blyttiomyces sp. JEL0837]